MKILILLIVATLTFSVQADEPEPLTPPSDQSAGTVANPAAPQLTTNPPTGTVANPAAPQLTTNAPVTPANFDGCDAKFSTALGKLLEADQNRILALQFKVTTLKMTKKLLATPNHTIESTLAADSAKLKTFDAENPDILITLNRLFDQNGGTAHTEDLKQKIAALKTKSSAASYWRSQSRLDNQEIATYLMMDKVNNPQTDVTQNDVAITWYMQKVSDEIARTKGHNSAAHNLSTMSTRLARNLGEVSGTTALTEAEINSQMTAAQSTIDEFLTSALATIKADASLAQCFKDDKWKGTCELNLGFIGTKLSEFLLNASDLVGFVRPPSTPDASPGLLAGAPSQPRPDREIRSPAARPRTFAERTADARRERERKVAQFNERHANAVQAALTAIGQSSTSGRYTPVVCGPKKTLQVRVISGAGRMPTITLADEYRTVKAGSSKDRQNTCMKDLIVEKCFPGQFSVNRSYCFD